MASTAPYLRTELAQQWQDQNVFSVVQQLKGDVFRDKEGRRTLRFKLQDKSYFLKVHQGIGWQEIIKNLLQLRMPVISAKNEWQAIRFLEKHQIDTMTIAAYGERGFNPAKIKSFIVTDELTESMSLEHLGQQWKKTPPTFKTKSALIEKLAQITKTMHENGMNHRDFYLCHFLLDQRFAEHNAIDENTKLFLIDLHRAQLRSKTPLRWIIKDLGSLYFSAAAVALTKRDLFRFMKIYSGDNLRNIVDNKQEFWVNVEQRANKLISE